MTLSRLAKTVIITIGAVLSCLILAVFIASVIDHAGLVYAAPEMQTAFMRSYEPDRVLDQFRVSRYSFSEGTSQGSGAGRGFATFERVVSGPVIIRSAEYPAFAAALNRDLTSLLVATGTPFVTETTDDTRGIMLHYQAGKSAGTATIEPALLIANPNCYGSQPLGRGEIAVWVQIRVDETWFKDGVPSPPPAPSRSATPYTCV
jgi:hypothetical protein